MAACKQAPKFDMALLTGEWKGAEWMVKGKPSGRDAREVRFTFDPAMTYTAAYGEQKESGIFRIDGEKSWPSPTAAGWSAPKPRAWLRFP